MRMRRCDKPTSSLVEKNVLIESESAPSFSTIIDKFEIDFSRSWTVDILKIVWKFLVRFQIGRFQYQLSGELVEIQNFSISIGSEIHRMWFLFSADLSSN